MERIGARLRAVREARGLGLREAARQLDVSASFLSQLETEKSQPSVATLYSLTRLLDVSIDQLFDDAATEAAIAAIKGGAPAAVEADATTVAQPAQRHPWSGQDAGAVALSRSNVGPPSDAWSKPDTRARFEIARRGQRPWIAMDSGVTWEQLCSNTGADMELLEVVYAPQSSSTNDGRMLRHEGYEYGYVLEGSLEITYGFDTFVVDAGDSFGFDSGIPHLFRNARPTSRCASSRATGTART